MDLRPASLEPHTYHARADRECDECRSSRVNSGRSLSGPVLPAQCNRDRAVAGFSERTDDILPLAQNFLGQDFELSEDALVALRAHDWPGNVRELRNAIERAKLLASETVSSTLPT